MALISLPAGCGSSSSQRPQVAGYIGALNKLERAAAAPLASVTQAGNRFSTERSSSGAPDVAVQRQLLTALSGIEALRRRAAALPVPAPALKLRSLVLSLFDSQTSLTREVAQLVVFLPRFGAALRPLTPAASRLAAVLSQTSASGTAAVSALYAAKAAALRRFKVTIDRVSAQLRALSPPAVSKPEFAAQLGALRGMSSSAGRLADAIGAGNLTGVQPLLVAFDQAAGSNHTVAAQKAQIAAVRAYDASVSRVTTLSDQIVNEDSRLANHLK